MRVVFALVVPALACSAEDGGGSSGSTSSSSGTAGDGGVVPTACEVTGAIADPLPLKVVAVATDGESVRAVSGASVEVRAYADDKVLASGATNIDGRADLSIPSGGRPVLGYVRVSRNGFATARYGYQSGFVGGVTGAINTFLPTAAELVSQAKAAGKTFDAKAASAVGITAYDCTDKLRLVGATFEVVPGSTVSYRDRFGAFDPTATKSAETGSGTDFAVPAGRSKVRVAKDGKSSEIELPIATGELFGIIMSL